MTQGRSGRHRWLNFESLEQRLALASIASIIDHPPIAPPVSGSLRPLAVLSSTINAGPGSNVIVLRATASKTDIEISIDGVLKGTYPIFNSELLTINGQGGNDVLVFWIM